ncbi:MAG TPA: AraC family transcriptional regulator [Pseudonocardia sp.]
MDAIDSLLDGPRARGAFLLRVELVPPWSMRIQDEAPLALVVVARGHAFVVPDDGQARELRQGDVVIAQGPAPYVVADDPATPVQVRICPGPRCVDVRGERLDAALDRATGWRAPSHGYVGVRTWGNTDGGSTQLLVGTYQMRGAVARRLTSALPTLAVLPGFGARSSLFTLLGEEITRDAPGQDVVLDRLLDLLLVAALRAWFSRPEAMVPRWYLAEGDPVIGPVLRMILDNPADHWTVASLAAAARLSRAAFARRFTELVGEPPIAFLTGWRLAAAADLLSDTDATLDAVARQVGYGSPFALSTAFKRFHGVSPEEHRRTAGRSL